MTIELMRAEKGQQACLPRCQDSTIKLPWMNGASHFQNAPVTNTNTDPAQDPGHHSHSVFREQIKEWLLPQRLISCDYIGESRCQKVSKYLDHINSFTPATHDREVSSQLATCQWTSASSSEMECGKRRWTEAMGYENQGLEWSWGFTEAEETQ